VQEAKFNNKNAVLLSSAQKNSRGNEYYRGLKIAKVLCGVIEYDLPEEPLTRARARRSKQNGFDMP
jgi:hypothetical protein